MHVFVYGTLKQGFWNHKYHLSKATFVNYGKTKARLKMLDTGGFPVVFNHLAAEAPVAGEVYDIDDNILIDLDRLEGNGRMFVRTLYEVELLDGSVIEASMYLGVPAFWRAAIPGLASVQPDTLGSFNWRQNQEVNHV